MPSYEVIALFTPADGREEAVHAGLAGLIAPSRAEPGNRAYTIRRTTATPQRYAVIETYEDEAAFEAHRATPHVTAFLAQADQLLAAPPEVLVLEPGEVH